MTDAATTAVAGDAPADPFEGVERIRSRRDLTDRVAGLFGVDMATETLTGAPAAMFPDDAAAVAAMLGEWVRQVGVAVGGRGETPPIPRVDRAAMPLVRVIVGGYLGGLSESVVSSTVQRVLRIAHRATPGAPGAAPSRRRRA